MTHNELRNMSLDALYDLHAGPQATPVDMPAFAAELAARLRQGRQAEVSAFLENCDGICRERLHLLRNEAAPWRQDPELWLALARVSIPLGELYAGDGGVAWRSAQMAGELKAMADAWLDQWRGRTHAAWRLRDGYDFVLRRVLGHLDYPDMPRDEVLALVRWALQLRDEAGLSADAQYYCNWIRLLAHLSEADLLALASEGQNVQLCRDIVQRLHPQQARLPASGRWAAWMDFFAQRPALYDQLPPQLQVPALIVQRWSSADAGRRQALAESFFNALRFGSQDDWPHDGELLGRLLQDDPAPLVAWLRKLGPLAINPAVAQRLWSARWPALTALMLPICAAGCERESERGEYGRLARAILAERPDDLLQASATQLAHLLPELPPAQLAGLLGPLGKAAAASGAKGLRAAIAQALAGLPPQAAREAGWLKRPNKNLLLAYRDVLVAHQDRAAAPLLAQLLASGLLDAAQLGPVQQRLQALGPLQEQPAQPGPEQPLKPQQEQEKEQGQANQAAPAGAAGAAEPSLDWLEQQAAGIQRLSPAVAALDRPALLQLMAPLSPHAARCLLHLAATAPAVLPQLAHQLLARIGAPERARLALALVEHWVAADGAPASRWVLKLLPGTADDGVVAPLAGAALAWHKSRKERAVVAIELLGALDSIYALSCLQALATGRGLKPSVMAAIEQALMQAAARRGMALADLSDELTPDFGLGQGLQLRVGAQAYTVLLQGDLSLRLRTPAGKLVRSLPATQDALLQADWLAASAQLKTVTNGVKQVLRQQAPRLRDCLLLGRGWPLARWQRLFLAHPLLGVLAQSLIWRVEPSPAGAPLSFRIAEDLSLVDAHSDVVQLPGDGRVTLWHPVQAPPEQVQAWRQSLQDYGIEPLLEQLDAPAALPSAQQWRQSLLCPTAAPRLTQQTLATLARRFGLQPGPVCDGPGIYLHAQDFPVQRWRLELHHGAAMPFHAPEHLVDIEGFALRDMASEELLAPALWPLPLQATLVAWLAAIAAKAEHQQDPL